MKYTYTPRRIDDALWKGLLENIFDDFLTFFFKNADEIFNLKRGFTYLDKELADLFPQPQGKAARHVDKLVKVFTKKGEPKWILVHIEVQGQKDNDFAFRMFTYYYRILDKYRVPVTAVAILTDAQESFFPSVYENSFMGTGNTFYFNTYKVLEQDQAELEQNDNPFAIAILTALIALKSKKIKDEKLFELKYGLLRNLLPRNISPEKINGLMAFLQLYIRFENPEYNRKFELVVDELTENKENMGIIEFVLDRAKNEGKKEGEQKGIEIGTTQKNVSFAKSLLSETDFTDQKIAGLIGVPVDFVQKLRQELRS